MPQTALEQLEQTKRRVDDANKRRNAIQVKLESARQQYAEAVKEAEAAHGTSDLDKLRKILADLEAENTKSLAGFVRAVDDYEALLARIEEALANPEAMNALLLSMAREEATAPAEPPSEAKVPAFNEDDI